MKRTSAGRRRGFTLMELMAAVAMMATLTASSVVLIRSTNDAWRRHRNDQEQRRQALAVLRHIVRRARQATAVTAISLASDASGTISLLMSDAKTYVWDHDDGTDEVRYGENSAVDLLGRGLTSMKMEGIQADGATLTTDVALIHSVRCTVTYELDRPAGATTETVSCQAWLRAW